ncbi:hypothetical protein HMPREF3204_00344, partial [Gardnerella pickettii]
SNSIRAAADTKKPNDTRLQISFNQKQNQSQIGTTATTSNTQEAERCETRISQPSYTPSKENRSRGLARSRLRSAEAVLLP